MAKQTSSIVAQVADAPNETGKGRVDFRQDDFDVLVHQKGYTVIWEKALRCPCRSYDTNSPTIACGNCGGTGWVFLNPLKTRMLVQSINQSNKRGEWSVELFGTSIISSRNNVRMGFMDRITLDDTYAIYSEVIYPISYNEEYHAFLMYNLVEAEAVFLYAGDGYPLTLLEEGTDYTVTDNLIKFTIGSGVAENVGVGIRYLHKVQFLIENIIRDIRMSGIKTDIERQVEFPISAMAKRSHLVLNPYDYDGEALFDNSY